MASGFSEEQVEKHQKVVDWLDEVLDSDSEQQFEISPQNIHLLYSLMTIQKKQDNCINHQLDDLKRKHEEYKSETQRIETILERVGLTDDHLTINGLEHLQTLTKLACLLDLANNNESSYLLALTNQKRALLDLEGEKLTEQQSTNRLQRSLEKIQLECANMERCLNDMEQYYKSLVPELEKKSKEASFHSLKAKEYEKTILKMKRLPKSCREVMHPVLVKNYEELQKLQQKLEPLLTLIESYDSLPPSVPATQVKIEEMKREIMRVESELSHMMEVASTV